MTVKERSRKSGLRKALDRTLDTIALIGYILVAVTLIVGAMHLFVEYVKSGM